jgi:hypothetical protein
LDLNESEFGVSAKYIKKGLEIVESAKKRNIELRLLGCIAVKLHCPKLRKFHEETMERHATDLDFIALSKDRSKIKELLEELGYGVMKTTVPMERRDIFKDKEELKVDVFFDKLEMCHVVDFKNRLMLDYPTISLADLILEKTQIVKITEKDIKDIVILLYEHDIKDSENDTINGRYIAELLAKDWGFYYTVTTNLKLIKDQFLEKWKNILSTEIRTNVTAKINMLLEKIEREPKSTGWKIRASVGTKKKWYRDVEEVETKGEFQDELKKLLHKEK